MRCTAPQHPAEAAPNLGRMATLTDTLLQPLVRASSPKPLITFYDDASGARVELSRATTANWAAKTANWLVDEWDVEPGAPVAVDLPAHWQTVGVFLGAWWCGAHIVPEAQEADVAFVPADAVQRGVGARTIAAVGLDALGAPLQDLRADAVDYIGDIRAHGDEFLPLAPVGEDAPALAGRTVAQVLAEAREEAAAHGLGATDRVLSTRDWSVPGGVLGGLLSVLATGGASLVQCAHSEQLDSEQWQRRRDNEKITAVLD